MGLMRVYRASVSSGFPPPEIPVVRVDHVVAKVAAFYEKIRSIVGWTEEHLIRKTAIARILRRTLALHSDAPELAETLVRDLVRGGYFPNGSIPVAKVSGLEAVLGKYLILFEMLKKLSLGEQASLREWLIDIAGCEVEAYLDPPEKEEALLAFMTEHMRRRIKIEDSLRDEDRENLIFIAVRQALFKFDESIITYQFIKKYAPFWGSFRPDKDVESLRSFGEGIQRWRSGIKAAFGHSALNKIYWAVEALDSPYLILGDVFSSRAKTGELDEAFVSDTEALESAAKRAYRERLKKQKRKAFRAAIYSTISIFSSKVLIAFLVEVPFDRYIGQYSEETLIANIAIPPVLMVLIVLWGLRRPPGKNESRVIEEVRRIIAGDIAAYPLKLKSKRSILIRGFVVLLYALGGAATFGAMIYLLTLYNFSVLSQAIFIFFVSLIAWSGSKIREHAKELVFGEKPPGFIHDLFLFFTFPIVAAGRWFSRQLLRIRPLETILDVFIELPFKFFVEFVEQWRAFLKEKKQEIH